jgi:hypothetical protein
MGNQVTLTFAGNSQPLEQSMDKTGQAAEVMAVRVTQATNASAERFDHLSSQSSLLSGGIGDVGGALTTAFGENTAIGEFGAKMESASAVVMGFTGVMDLGVFATNNFKLASAAQAVQTGVTSAATKTAAAAQWLMNTALLASPITWIVIGIVALIAVIVLIAKKTDWFSQAWRASWKWIKSSASNTWDFIKKIPGWIGTAFRKVADFISLPFRTAFNLIARAWNNTIGRLSWTVPSWIPGIGGNSISVPHLPTFHAGGVVPGITGRPTMVMAQGGERIPSLASNVGGGGQIVYVRGDGLVDALIEAIAAKIGRGRGGDPAALGLRIV